MIFFKTRPPVEPVSFVKAICSDAANGVDQKRSRFVKRLTPMTVIGKATDKGIDDVAGQVVAPHFHGPDRVGRKVRFEPLLLSMSCVLDLAFAHAWLKREHVANG